MYPTIYELGGVENLREYLEAYLDAFLALEPVNSPIGIHIKIELYLNNGHTVEHYHNNGVRGVADSQEGFKYA